MVQWTDKLDKKFLKETLKVISPSIPRETWVKVAEAMGIELSTDACRFHYAKLQKEEDTDIPTSAAATPEKPVKSPRKRKSAKDSGDTPSKPTKKAKKGTATPKKEEEHAEEGIFTDVKKEDSDVLDDSEDGTSN